MTDRIDQDVDYMDYRRKADSGSDAYPENGNGYEESLETAAESKSA